MHEMPGWSADAAPHSRNGSSADGARRLVEQPNTLPEELRELFARTGPGCLAVKTDQGVVHLCHAADADIQGFANAPVAYRWMLVAMPTAPLIRLELLIVDVPDQPYMFESFLNVDDEEQAGILADLAGQPQLHLAFYGSDLTYRFTKLIPQDEQIWQGLDEMITMAEAHCESIPLELRDFDRAKAEFMRRYP